MAFTATEKVKIRFYCGWSARFHQFDSRLEQAISAVEVDTDTETFVRGIIADCDDTRTKLTAAHSRLKAMKVGSIGLSGPNELMMLRSEGRRHTGELCSVLGVERRHDVFGSSRYRYFASHTGLHVDGVFDGNYYPHG